MFCQFIEKSVAIIELFYYTAMTDIMDDKGARHRSFIIPCFDCSAHDINHSILMSLVSKRFACF
jgi:hypothetical protein